MDPDYEPDLADYLKVEMSSSDVEDDPDIADEAEDEDEDTLYIDEDIDDQKHESKAASETESKTADIKQPVFKIKVRDFSSKEKIGNLLDLTQKSNTIVDTISYQNSGIEEGPTTTVKERPLYTSKEKDAMLHEYAELNKSLRKIAYMESNEKRVFPNRKYKSIKEMIHARMNVITRNIKEGNQIETSALNVVREEIKEITSNGNNTMLNPGRNSLYKCKVVVRLRDPAKKLNEINPKPI